jgi:hypothetical protein
LPAARTQPPHLARKREDPFTFLGAV